MQMVLINCLHGMLMWQAIYKTITNGKANGNLVLLHDNFIKFEDSHA
jgi:hypothetical protein